MGLELLLPVILFLITLVIIYLLRVEDKRDRRLDLMKQKVNLFSREVESARSQFKDTAQQVEERVNHKIEASNQMLMRLDSQLTELEVRSEDLAKLQSVLNTYRDSLTKLGATTAQVEARIEQVKQEVHRIEAVQAIIDGFDTRIESFRAALQAMVEEGTEAISNQQLRVKQLLDTSYAKLQEYESEVQEVERANQGRVASHAEMLKGHEAASLAVLSGQLAKIRQLGDESEQIIASNEHALELAREQAFQDLNEQKKNYEAVKTEIEKALVQQKQTLQDLSEEVNMQSLQSLKAFSQQCNIEMENLFTHTIAKTDQAFQTMIHTITSFIQELQERVVQAQQMSEKLKEQEHVNLETYASQIQLLVKRNDDVQESLRRGDRKQEELAQVIAHLRDEASSLHTELDRLNAEKEHLVVTNSQESNTAATLAASIAALALQLNQKQDELQVLTETIQQQELQAQARQSELEEAAPSDEDEPSDDNRTTKKEKIWVEYIPEGEEEEITLDEEEDKNT
ncbi:MAG: hypothetical protein VB010_09540 [Sphaerochaeta associata]|uniref:SpiroCoCo family coiled-coil protein n=1 Tax=Sphaerochaeta associata TaxID=1129264 RepID=UPI002B1EC50D|nr:hypothetical protein [Sphaerochaeta associata]MEA5107587.1 hypothetical protein [Sphaerochaeta associata]